MTQGIRIDIISGLPGTGKTTFIGELMKSVPSGGCIAVGASQPDATMPLGLLANRRPARILLEAPPGMGLQQVVDWALNDKALWPSFLGSRVVVLDALYFGRFMQETAQIEMASHVFINRAKQMVCSDQAKILKTIWNINPRVNILMDPLDGLDLWKLLDILPPEEFAWI